MHSLGRMIDLFPLIAKGVFFQCLCLNAKDETPEGKKKTICPFC